MEEKKDICSIPDDIKSEKSEQSKKSEISHQSQLLNQSIQSIHTQQSIPISENSSMTNNGSFNTNTSVHTSTTNNENNLNINVSYQSYNTNDSNTETKYSTSLNNISSFPTHHIPEVNACLEELTNIKAKDNDFISNEELESDIARLQVIIDDLLNYSTEDPQLIVYINEAENLKDTKRYIKQREHKHFATYNKYIDKELETDAYGNFTMSKVFLNKMICEKTHLYYRTHELNDVLYLHFNAFKKIENLDSFINLKVLYLENNCIKKIEGLNNLKSLTCLYLQENMIEKIENIEELVNLNTLNLSDNNIKKIENLKFNKKLNSLLLKRNKIGFEEGDLDGLLELSPTVTVIDISDNKINDADIIDKYLISISGLKVLYMFGNECARKIPHYRKTLTYKLQQLRYIDDKPIFEDEKRFAIAFAKGGLEEEKKEREKYRQEKKDEQIKRIQDFQDMVSGWQGKNQQKEVVELSKEDEKLKFEEGEEKEDAQKTNSTDKKMEMLLKMNSKLKEERRKKEEVVRDNSVVNNETKAVLSSHKPVDIEVDVEEKGNLLNIQEETIEENKIVPCKNSQVSTISCNNNNNNNSSLVGEEVKNSTTSKRNKMIVYDSDEEENEEKNSENQKNQIINHKNNDLVESHLNSNALNSDDNYIPSLEEVKFKRDSGWIERELAQAKLTNNENKISEQSSIVDIREINNSSVVNTHKTNSIFDELD